MQNKKILRAQINKAGYKGFFQIENISFSLEKGEILLITGRSGSGKTTLLKTLLGTLKQWPEGFIDGEIIYKDKPLTSYPLDKLYREIAYIPQDPWYGIIAHTVEAEYCLSMAQSGIECNPSKLTKYGLGNLTNHITYGLSAGQCQRLLWAEAFERNAELLIMDEPLVYIDRETRRKLHENISEFTEKGGTVVIVDHMPHEWSSLSPKLLILENGKTKYYGKYREEVLPRLPSLEVTRKKPLEPTTLLQAENIWFKYPASPPVIKGVNLVLRRGEIIGIKGPNGVGKSTLLKILAGIYKPCQGKVHLKGRTMYLPENPLLFFTHPTPREELYSIVKPRIDPEEIIRLFGMTSLLDRPLSRLSSGERRRIALASIFLRGADILLLDEPSAGLDHYNLAKLTEQLLFLADHGIGIIIASHDERLNPIYWTTCMLTRGELKCE